MTKTMRVPDAVYEQAEKVQTEHEYATLGEAVRHVFREAGYDV